METAKQVRYLELRQQLSEINCPSHFGIDSMDCVEYLIKTVLTTTNSYKLCREKEERLAADLALAQAQLFPLRKENAALARESHQLHEENIKIREENSNFQAEQMNERKHLEDRVNELIYVCKSKDAYITKVEADLERIRNEMGEFARKKDLRPAISPSKTLAAPKPNMAASTRGILNDVNDSGVLDKLRKKLEVADKSIIELTSQNMKLVNALKIREHELNRDARILDSQGSMEKTGDGVMSTRMQQIMAAEAQNRGLIDQLNGQVDFLNQELALREAQLVEMGNKLLATDMLQADLNQKNVMLERLRLENASLAAQTRTLDQKIVELSEALEVGGSASTGLNAVSQSRANTNEVQLELPSAAAHKTAVGSTIKVPSANQRTGHSFGSGAHELDLSDVSILSDGMRQQNRLGTTTGPKSRAVNGIRKLPLPAKANATTTHIISSARSEGISSRRPSTASNVSAAGKSADQSEGLIKKLTAERDMLILELQHAKKDNNLELSHERDMLQRVVEELQSELNASRAEKAEALAQLDTAQLAASKIRRELSEKTGNVGYVATELSSVAEEKVHLEFQLDNLKHELELAEGRCEELTERCAATEEDLAKCRRELANAAQQLVGLEGQAELSHEGDLNAKQLKSTIQSLRQRLEEAEKSNLRLQQLNSNLELSMQHLSSSNASSGNIASLLDEERKRWQEELSKKDDNILSLEQELRHCEAELERASSNMLTQKDALSMAHAQVEAQVQQQRRLAQELSQQESEVKLLQRRLEDATSAYGDSRQSVSDSSRQIAMLSDKYSRSELELSGAKETINALNREKLQLEDEIRSLRRANESLHRKSVTDKDEIQSAHQQLQEATRRIDELKVLISSLETNYRIQSDKNAQLNAMLFESDKAQQQLEDLTNTLKNNLAEKDSIISEYLSTITSINEEKSKLEEGKDHEAIKAEQVVRRCNMLEQQLAQTRVTHDKLEGRLQEVNADLASAQNHSNALTKRISALREENLDLKKKLGMKASEMGGAAEDLMLMTRENQALTSELAEITAERDRLHLRLQQLSQAIADMDQVKCGLMIEKDDLLEAYKTVLQEKRQLENEFQNMGSLRQKANYNAQKLNEQIAELSGQVKAFSMNEARHMQERESLVGQIEELNDELVKSQRNYEAVLVDSRRLAQEVQSLKQSNALLTERIQLVIKRAAAAAEANKVLTTRLSTVERERDAVRSMINVERQKTVDLSQMMDFTRAQLIQKEMQIGRVMSATEGLDSYPASSGSASYSPRQQVSAQLPSPKVQQSPSMLQRTNPNPSSNLNTSTGSAGANSSGSASSSASRSSNAGGSGSGSGSGSRQEARGDDDNHPDELSESLGLYEDEDSFEQSSTA